MNCDYPTIAVRRSGINPATGTGYKPHLFIKYEHVFAKFKNSRKYSNPRHEADAYFTALYFDLKRKFDRPGILCDSVCQDDFFNDPSHPWYNALKRSVVRRERVDRLCEVLLVGCNRCVLCRQRNKKMWATRCIHEAQMCNGGVFLTLTVSDDSLERTFPGGSLTYKPFQDFMKRLRKGTEKYKMVMLSDHPIRFFMCGEYGEQFWRPHYHVCLFGCDFPDKFVQRYTEDGQPLYDSPFLIELRHVNGVEVFGEVSNFAPITPYDVSYTAGYVEKKIFKDQSEYVKRGLEPEFVRMSRRPGIGLSWLNQYHSDCWKFHNEQLIHEGCFVDKWKNPVPRYYFEKSKIGGLLSHQECDIIFTHHRGRVSEVSSDPDMFMDSLEEGHAKAEKVRKRLSQVLRSF